MDIFSLVGKITVNYGDAVKGIDEVSSKAGNLASSLGKTMQDAGDKMTSAGKTIAPVSVAVGGVATAAIKTAMDFDSSMSKVKAISGATGEDFQKLRDKAIEMGGKTKFSVSEAAEAFSYMAMAGWNTSDMLSGIEGVMNLAAASGENLGTTSDIVTDALTAFGLSASDSGHFADVLAAAATSANTDVYKMGETFKYAAPVMGALGYSAEDTSLAIGLMGDSSIKAGMAGTVLRSSFSRLANPTDAMVESMIAFGLATQETGVDQEKLEKAQRKVEKVTIDVEKKQVAYNQAVAKYGANSPQAQKALLDVEKKTIDLADAQANLEKVQNTLVGTGEVHNLILNDEEGNARSLRDVIIFLRESLGNLDEQEQAAAVSAIFGTEAMSGMLAIINASDEDFNELASAIDGCDGAAQEIAGTMQDNLAGQITELMSQLQVLAVSIVDLFTPAMRGIVSHVQDFVSWLISLDDGTKTLIGTIALVVAGLSPVLITGGKVISGIGKIIGAIGSITGAVGKVIRAVSSVTGAIGKVVTIVPKITGVVSSAVGFVTGTVIPAIGAVVSAIGIVPIAIAAAIAVVIGVIALLWNKCDWFREGVIAIWEAIKSGAIAIWNAIKDFLVNLWDGIVQTAKSVFEGLASFLSSCWEGIKSVLTTVWTAISKFFSTVWEGIKKVVTVVVREIQTFLTNAWNTIKTSLTTVLTAIKTVFTTVWNAIKTAITTVVNAIKTFITTAWNTIKSTITNILNGIKTAFSTVWNGIKSVVTSVINAIKSFITSVFNAIKTTITNVLNGIKNTASTVWNGIKTVISNVLNGIKSTVSNIWNGIKSTVSNILNGIKSTVSNVWNGIKSTVSTVMSAIQSVISTVMNGIKTVFINGWNSIKSTTSNVLSGIKSTISNGLEGTKNAAGNALGAIKDKFSSTFESSKNIVKSGIDKMKSFFNFSWSLPKLKLPHFSIKGKFSLDPPSIPSFGVQWYAKAMKDGMIMNQPTVFGYNARSNQLLAGGEAGSETVVGTESLMNMIRDAVSSENGELIEVLNQILKAVVSLDEGLEGKFYNALLNMRFQINEREFARLVKAV